MHANTSPTYLWAYYAMEAYATTKVPHISMILTRYLTLYQHDTCKNDSDLKLRATSLLDRRGGASQCMGKRIKGFYFVTWDPPEVGLESRVMGNYPARFGEHF
ncbi:hypothetical protein L6452_34656 [Arctium lappa]|uniref:Uncharacterized protein n=1 Tax=Arctium lappa TaxID=4217 RepID=A0ACB8YJC0_ARCLA|nr:hypothetical protein L6452_34656 [Arctium lappa]